MLTSKMKIPEFVAIEGVDGSGKTYLARKITDWLNANEKDSAIYTKEPYRSFWVEPGVKLLGDYRPQPYYLDRIYHFADVIFPTLNIGKHVVCDRFQLSTYVYQAESESLFTPVYNSYAFYALPLSRYKEILEGDICKDLIDPDVQDVANRLFERGERVDTNQIRRDKELYVDALSDFYRNYVAWVEGPVNIIRAKTADEAFAIFKKRWDASSDCDSSEPNDE